MAGMVPELKRITVDVKKLYLDPNNPRFVTSKDDLKKEEDTVDLNEETKTKMDSGAHDIKSLIDSIKVNGWIPIDHVFVKSLPSESGRYVVLEGNRRVTALQKILNDEDDISTDKESIEKIEVMEVLDDGDLAIPLADKITYLLGVRHHGSLKKWSPFARAQNIYLHYLELTDQ